MDAGETALIEKKPISQSAKDFRDNIKHYFTFDVSDIPYRTPQQYRSYKTITDTNIIKNLLKQGGNVDNLQIRIIRGISKEEPYTVKQNKKFNVITVEFNGTTIDKDDGLLKGIVTHYIGRTGCVGTFPFDCIKLEDQFYVISDKENDYIAYYHTIKFLNAALQLKSGSNIEYIKSANKR